MIVKTFEGVSMPEAMKAVKSEFGSDAVILEVKEDKCRRSNLSTFKIRAATSTSKYDSRSNSVPGSILDHEELTQMSYRLDRIEYHQQKLIENMINEKHLNILLDQNREIKLLLSESMTNSGVEVPKYLESIFQQFVVNGVYKNYLLDLKKHLISNSKNIGKTSNLNSDDEYYRSLAIKWVMRKIKIYHPSSFVSDTARIHAFVGPSGAGKTLLITKLASYLKKNKNKIPYLVSLQSSGLASNEVLKVYAKMLDLKFQHVEKVEDLKRVVDAIPQQYHILIDSAGINTISGKDLIELSDTIKNRIDSNNHLVLPLCEKTIQLDRYISSFGSCELSSLAFTKLDSSWQFGDLFNLAYKWGLPLSLFSTGQNVPDDFELASKERIVEKLFGI